MGFDDLLYFYMLSWISDLFFYVFGLKCFFIIQISGSYVYCFFYIEIVIYNFFYKI